jgi:hypothetical protein
MRDTTSRTTTVLHTEDPSKGMSFTPTPFMVWYFPESLITLREEQRRSRSLSLPLSVSPSVPVVSKAYNSHDFQNLPSVFSSSIFPPCGGGAGHGGGVGLGAPYCSLPLCGKAPWLGRVHGAGRSHLGYQAWKLKLHKARPVACNLCQPLLLIL